MSARWLEDGDRGEGLFSERNISVLEGKNKKGLTLENSQIFKNR